MLCECGCGGSPKGGRFLRGHNARCRSPETRLKLSLCSLGNQNRKGAVISLEQRIKQANSLRGFKHTEETKRKISAALMGKQNAKGNHIKRSKAFCEFRRKAWLGNKAYQHSYGKRSHYESPFQGTVCFRSSYELAYAKYLDSIGELWMYEAFTFSLTCGTYTPDFFLPRQEKFVEIKGYMFPDARQKVEQFQEEYTEELEVLYQEGLAELGVFV